jgi:hypothetical protein
MFLPNRNAFLCLFVVCMICSFLSSCGTSTPIQRVSESRTHFGSPPKLMSHSYAEQDLYRIYHRGATGFVTISALRTAAEERAQKFCDRLGRTMIVLGEKASPPPHILGNFPRIEIIFAAAPRGGFAGGGSSTQYLSSQGPSISRLTKLKRLRDEGLITSSEFEAEKRRYLDN